MSREVAIIGDGMVGSTIAYTLFLRRSADVITLIDTNRPKAESDALDMMHAVSLLGGPAVRAGGYQHLDSADVIVITASVPGRNISSRDELLAGNAKLFSTICSEIKPHLNPKAVITVVSNPLDVIAHLVQKLLDIEPERVVGTGTLLESSRLRYATSQRIGCHPQDVNAMTVGEHGDRAVALTDEASVGGIEIADLIDEPLDELSNETVNGGYQVQSGKGYTNFGVAGAACVLVESILADSHRVLPVCSYDKDLGIYISSPTEISREGAVRHLHPKMSLEEKKRFKASIVAIRSNCQLADSTLEKK